MKAEVLVIGAGLGGLAAAISLAARGVGVHVVEAADGPGGKAAEASVDGVTFDTGPSVLTLPEVVEALFTDAGERMSDALRLRRCSPAFSYVFPDGVRVDLEHALPATLASVSRSLGPAAAEDLDAFLTYAGRIWSLSAPAFVMGPAPGLHLLRSLGLSMLRFGEVDPFRSMQAAIRQRVRSPHLRAILARYATYNGSDPRRAPATLNCISHVELAMGGYGVEGGVYALVRALEGLALRQGVRFTYGARVRSLILEGGRARGAEVAGAGRLEADAVVCNADVAHLLTDLTPPGALSVSGGPASMSGWTGVIQARRRAGRPAHLVLFPEDYDQEFIDIFDRDQPPTQPTVYACAQEPCHGRRGWPGHEPLFIMANAPPEPEGGARDAGVWEVLQARCMARLSGAGLIDTDDALVWTRTPAELALRFPRSRGALYGAASNSMFSAFQRPPNRAPGLGGLYLASGSAHPGGGMPLCIRSGQEAARALVVDLGLQGAPPA